MWGGKYNVINFFLPWARLDYSVRVHNVMHSWIKNKVSVAGGGKLYSFFGQFGDEKLKKV